MRHALLIGLALVTQVTASAGEPVRRTLTFEDRVTAQKVIEQVHWSHRIWPKENPAPRPPLSAVMSDEEIRLRVEDYVRKANAIEKFWQQRLTDEQLQAEIDRMIRDSRDTMTLRELFVALGNDPLLIANTLATQTLVDRLIHDWYAYDDRFHGHIRNKAESELAACDGVGCMRTMSGDYRETTWRRGASDERSIGLDSDEWSELHRRLAATPPRKLGHLEEDVESFSASATLSITDDEISTATIVWPKTPFDTWWRATASSVATTTTTVAGNFRVSEPRLGACQPDTWRPTISLLEGRHLHTAVWTGSEMIVWGGMHGLYLNNGGRYTPSTDSWVPTSLGSGTPVARVWHTAVWSGSEMIVWGGQSDLDTTLATGARYNPVTDSWIPISSDANVPGARFFHTAVWSGSEMIVWGGNSGGFGGVQLDSGGRYNPSTDSWSTISTAAGVPTAREFHSAVWTGSQLIVWGGRGSFGGGSFNGVNTGGRYSPSTDTWAPTSTGTGVPDYRSAHTAVWTGTEMIVWGGSGFSTNLATGGRYDPVSDSWLPTSTESGVPAGRVYHTAIWSGSEMLVWGGSGRNAVELQSGGRYDPLTNTWSATSQGPNVPTARESATAVWTGTEMLIWGGTASHGPTYLDTGGRYNPSSNTWLPTSRGANVPTARSFHSAVWTGSEMIVWGGASGTALFATGGRYVPSTDSWAPTAMGGNVPEGRLGHTALWTGKHMIVWGGTGLHDVRLATGGRYNPSTNVWITTTTIDAADARDAHTAVWTGTEMIVWGGYASSEYSTTNTGGRYDPTIDSWMPTSTAAGVPTARQHHTAVWTGTEMIVWGGYGDGSDGSTGGRYRPSTDGWAPTSTLGNAPTARWGHTAVWTGSEMIIWGGYGGADELDTGGRYDPSVDSWIPTPDGSPGGRARHTAVWTGSEMVVWGGAGGSTYPPLGVRYSPIAASWVPIPPADDVPWGRVYHTAVWTGTEMIIWGGGENHYQLSTGAAYCACPIGRLLYRDADGDGYGNPGVSISSCEGDTPAGFVVDRTDCYDVATTVHPGATETCNNFDDDCDGTLDDGGDALCDDANACTSNLCSLWSGCVYRPANFDTSDFSATRVDGRDLVVLAEAWNTCPGNPAYNAAADIDQVPCIDLTDFHWFMVAFGQTCP